LDRVREVVLDRLIDYVNEFTTPKQIKQNDFCLLQLARNVCYT